LQSLAVIVTDFCTNLYKNYEVRPTFMQLRYKLTENMFSIMYITLQFLLILFGADRMTQF